MNLLLKNNSNINFLIHARPHMGRMTETMPNRRYTRARHKSRDTVTISGPKIPVMEFIQQLKSEGIFAKEVDSSNVAFHSYYMTSIAPSLKSSLEKIIRSPKQRSSKWISTSIPEQRCKDGTQTTTSTTYAARFCSKKLKKCIPANAITIEIALLQAILKRSLSAQTVFIPLMKKDATNQVEFV
jgi:fatty acid synthase, animal type